MKQTSQIITSLGAILCFLFFFSGRPETPVGGQLQAYAGEQQPHAKGQLPVLSKGHVAQVIRAFSEILVAKDTAGMMEVASPQFAVATASWPSSASYLQMIFNAETFDSIAPAGDEVTLVKGSPFKQRVGAVLYPKGKEPVPTTVTFDARCGKILCVDYFDGRFGLFRDRPSQLAAVLPFEQEEDKGAIIIYLKLNGFDEPLRFLFDSGADGMAISAEAAEKHNVKPSFSQGTSVVGGNASIQVSAGNTVLLDTLQLLDQNIAIFPTMRDGIAGLVGLNIVKRYITKVNFDEKKMYLYTFGSYEYEAGGEIEHVSVPRGIINIPGYLNLIGKDTVEGNFVFDTGAEYHLMGFSPWVRKNRLLLRGFKPESQGSTASMGIVTPTYEGKAVEFGFGATVKMMDMPVSLQASTSTSTNWAPPADGSVGVKLISRYNFTINLLEKEVHFSPRK